MSTPNSNNMYLGSGALYFNRFDSSGNLTQWRHLGNCTKFELLPNVTTVEKYSSMSGARGLYGRAVTQTNAEVDITLNEFDAENIALAFLGTSNAYAQSSGTATDAAISGTTKKGYGLETGKKKITVTNVKVASTTYTLGTDYTVDSDSGMILITPGSTIPDASTITWSGTYPTIASFDVAALANAILNGRLKFVSATDATGPRYEVEVWKCSMSPSGNLGFIGDQFGEIALKGFCLQDTTQAAGNQFFHARQL